MPRRRTDKDESRPWYENWWAGADLDEHRRDISDQRALMKRERDDARRWAGANRARGGVLRRLLG
jgi:hypothetical protein